jgi:high affinity Mn2+ porin
VSLTLAAPTAAGAADSYPTKAPTPELANWTGFYLGGHLGYAGGWSNWSANDGLSTVSGSPGLFSSYGAFKGTGSYLFGLQAGYNLMLPSRLVMGFKAVFSAPMPLLASRR